MKNEQVRDYMVTYNYCGNVNSVFIQALNPDQAAAFAREGAGDIEILEVAEFVNNMRRYINEI